jgi:hypothetical protein
MKTHKVNTLISNPYGSTVTITVIGAGGTGSILLTTLARLNQAILRLKRTYLRIRVYDPDRITENNPSPSCSLAESLGQQHIMINDLCAKVASCLIWDLFTQERIDWRGSFISLDNLNIKKLRIL